MIDYDSPRNQTIKGKLVANHIIHNVSHLVGELASKAEEFPEYTDELYSAFQGNPDYEEAANDNDWQEAESGVFYIKDENQHYLSVNLNERGLINVSVHKVTEPGQGSNGKEVWSFNGTWDEVAKLDRFSDLDTKDITDTNDLLDYLSYIEVLDTNAELYDDEDCDFQINETAEDWKELCEDGFINADDYRRDIYEHWIISDWFAGKLEEHGELVLRDFFGMTVWGRTTSGQAILLDWIISAIAEDMEILEGQANEWEV